MFDNKRGNSAAGAFGNSFYISCIFVLVTCCFFIIVQSAARFEKPPRGFELMKQLTWVDFCQSLHEEKRWNRTRRGAIITRLCAVPPPMSARERRT